MVWNKHLISTSKLEVVNCKIGLLQRKKLDNNYIKCLYCKDLDLEAPVAQLDRVTDFESEGCRFESCRAHLQFVA